MRLPVQSHHAPSSHVCARDHRQATILLQVSPGLFLFGAGFKLHVARNLKQQALACAGAFQV